MPSVCAEHEHSLARSCTMCRECCRAPPVGPMLARASREGRCVCCVRVDVYEHPSSTAISTTYSPCRVGVKYAELPTWDAVAASALYTPSVTSFMSYL